jgi:hypothetical protein
MFNFMGSSKKTGQYSASARLGRDVRGGVHKAQRLRSYLCGVDEARRAVVELRFLGVAGPLSGRWSPDALSAALILIGSVKKSRKGGLPTVTPLHRWIVTELTIGPELALKVGPGADQPP